MLVKGVTFFWLVRMISPIALLSSILKVQSSTQINVDLRT